jgi:hypothetical protein
METIALESKTTRRPALLWVATMTVAALVTAIALALTSSSSTPRSTGRTTRPVASVSTEIAGPTATGRPRAYHSKQNSSCSRFITLPKRGKVCLERREEARKKAQ